jgi:hypothetical protein
MQWDLQVAGPLKGRRVSGRTSSDWEEFLEERNDGGIVLLELPIQKYPSIH